MNNNNIKNYQEISEIIRNAPSEACSCLSKSMKQVRQEVERGGKFTTIDNFIDRMLAAGMDIHAFTIIGKYIPMKFSGDGDARMLRAVLALRGYDPDYSVAPEIITYTTVYNGEGEEDDDDYDEEELPFM